MRNSKGITLFLQAHFNVGGNMIAKVVSCNFLIKTVKLLDIC